MVIRGFKWTIVLEVVKKLAGKLRKMLVNMLTIRMAEHELRCV